MKFKQFLKILGKNLLAGMGGAVIGIIVSVLYTIVIWLPANSEKIGLGIIAVLPVMIILFSILGIIIGGILGIILYQIIKLRATFKNLKILS